VFSYFVDKTFSKTEFECLPIKGTLEFRPGAFNSSVISELSYTAFKKIAFYFRPGHLKLLCARLNSDSGASANDRFVIQSILKNACIAAKGDLCLCQDTGTACVYVWMDQGIVTDEDPAASLSRGVEAAYTKHNLRASQLVATDFFCEKNTHNNLPAQVVLYSRYPNSVPRTTPAMRFLFTAKGGGSANKTGFWAMSPSILEKKAFDKFLTEKIEELGTSACPPYRLAVVVGGLSPEQNMEALKLAASEILDSAPYFEAAYPCPAPYTPHPIPYSCPISRDRFWEGRAMEIAACSGIGAQAGGTSLCLDSRVLRLPRHAASCFVSIGVSCCAHRNVLGYINARGAFLEKLAENPAAVLDDAGNALPYRAGDSVEAAGFGAKGAVPPSLPLKINLNRPVSEICAELRKLEKQKIILVSGKIITARDAAHKKWHCVIEAGGELPQYLLEYPVFYAGPSAAPALRVCGSIGPTTAGRMDAYCEELFSRGASLLSIAKGKRSAAFEAAAAKWGAVYLCAIGGAAALISETHIVSAAVIDFPELEMEAVRLLEVKDLPVVRG
jgi:fumarate hydratase class I